MYCTAAADRQSRCSARFEVGHVARVPKGPLAVWPQYEIDRVELHLAIYEGRAMTV